MCLDSGLPYTARELAAEGWPTALTSDRTVCMYKLPADTHVGEIAAGRGTLFFDSRACDAFDSATSRAGWLSQLQRKPLYACLHVCISRMVCSG